MKIRRNGLVELVGYGIGDSIDVLEPSLVYPVALSERLSEIPLVDGSFIVECPDEVRVERNG